MNKNLLVGVMYRNGDTQKSLANAIKCSLQQFNAKLNERNGAEFTQGEIQAIRSRYNLTSEELDDIFLAPMYLKSVYSVTRKDKVIK